MINVKLMKLLMIILKDIQLVKDTVLNTYWNVLKLMMKNIINKLPKNK